MRVATGIGACCYDAAIEIGEYVSSLRQLLSCTEHDDATDRTTLRMALKTTGRGPGAVRRDETVWSFIIARAAAIYPLYLFSVGLAFVFAWAQVRLPPHAPRHGPPFACEACGQY